MRFPRIPRDLKTERPVICEIPQRGKNNNNARTQANAYRAIKSGQVPSSIASRISRISRA
ncbi:hypothetical protein BH11ARM2_BH11ARM2_04080 [soil metagenome]